MRNVKHLYATSPWLRHIRHVRERCRKKGIPCSITEKEVRGLWHAHEAGKMKNPSLQRIAKEWGYVKNNVRWVDIDG